MDFKLSASVLALAALMASCGSKSTESQATAEASNQDSVSEQPAASNALVGQWVIEEIGRGEGRNLHPAQDTPDVEETMTFNADNTVGLTTNCNSIGAEYKLSGKSLTFLNPTTTLMDCPDMEIETTLNALLPEIISVSMLTDSTALLNTDTAGRFIYLRRTASASQPE